MAQWKYHGERLETQDNNVLPSRLVVATIPYEISIEPSVQSYVLHPDLPLPREFTITKK